jgi:putative membrane protein
MMWGLGYGGWGHWLGWLGPVVMVGVWALVIAGGVFLVRFLVRQARGQGQSDSALEVLKRRYAQGDISREEFEEKRRDLA